MSNAQFNCHSCKNCPEECFSLSQSNVIPVGCFSSADLLNKENIFVIKQLGFSWIRS